MGNGPRKGPLPQSSTNDAFCALDMATIEHQPALPYSKAVSAAPHTE